MTAPVLPRSARELPLLLLLATLWGGSYSFIRIGVQTIPPVTLIAIRTLIAGLLLAAWMRAIGVAWPRDAATWRAFATQALLNSVLPFTLIAWAEQSVSAGVATILCATPPIFTFVATWRVTRHEAVSARQLFGVVCGLAGVCAIVGPAALGSLGAQLLPQLAVLAAALCYAAAAIYSTRFKGLAPVQPAAGSLVVGAALLVPTSLLVDRPWQLQVSAASALALLALAVLSTALAFVIYFRLIQTLGSVRTTSQAFLRVPIGVGLGVWWLGESLSATVWLGMGLVVIGVAAMTLPARTAARLAAQEVTR